MEVVMLLMTYLRNYMFQNETKDVNVEVPNTIARIYNAKALIKHISCDCKCKFNNTTCNSNQK